MCPPGQDCGIEEEAGHEVVINYLQTEETSAGADTGAGMIAGIVVSVVLVISIMACSLVTYYRCRDLYNTTELILMS